MRVGNRLYLRGKLDAQGRLLIPAEVREAMGAKPGDVMALTYEDGGELTVITFRENLRRIQEEAAKYGTPGRSLVDELIAERRAEAAKDDEEARESRRQRGIPEPTPEDLVRQEQEADEFIKKWIREHRGD